APLQITGAGHRMRLAGDFPAAKVLATGGQAQFLGSIRAQLQNPFREPLGIKPFARLGNAVSDLGVGVAPVFLIEAAQGGFESLGIAGAKWSVHAPDYSRNGFRRKADLPPEASMMAAAAVAAGFIPKIRLPGNAAQFQCF